MGGCGSLPVEIDQSYFKIGKPLGKGGFGRVSAAIRTRDRKKSNPQFLAIKCISKARLLGQDRHGAHNNASAHHHHHAGGGNNNTNNNNNNNTGRSSVTNNLEPDPGCRTRSSAAEADRNASAMIWSERTVMASVRCPYLVPLLHAFQTPEELFLVMPCYIGGDVHSFLNRHVRMQEDVARLYAAEIVVALEHIHSLFYVYRDVKPMNLLFDREGHIAVTDYGLCRKLEEDQGYCIVGRGGTRGYRAPEVAAGQSYDFSCDFFSFGITLYELVTGRRKAQSLHPGTVVSTNDIRANSRLSTEVKDLIRKLTMPVPADRLGCELSCLRMTERCKRLNVPINQFNAKRTPLQRVFASSTVDQTTTTTATTTSASSPINAAAQPHRSVGTSGSGNGNGNGNGNVLAVDLSLGYRDADSLTPRSSVGGPNSPINNNNNINNTLNNHNNNNNSAPALNSNAFTPRGSGVAGRSGAGLGFGGRGSGPRGSLSGRNTGLGLGVSTAGAGVGVGAGADAGALVDDVNIDFALDINDPQLLDVGGFEVPVGSDPAVGGGAGGAAAGDDVVVAVPIVTLERDDDDDDEDDGGHADDEDNHGDADDDDDDDESGAGAGSAGAVSRPGSSLRARRGVKARNTRTSGKQLPPYYASGGAGSVTNGGGIPLAHPRPQTTTNVSTFFTFGQQASSSSNSSTKPPTGAAGPVGLLRPNSVMSMGVGTPRHAPVPQLPASLAGSSTATNTPTTTVNPPLGYSNSGGVVGRQSSSTNLHKSGVLAPSTSPPAAAAGASSASAASAAAAGHSSAAPTSSANAGACAGAGATGVGVGGEPADATVGPVDGWAHRTLQEIDDDHLFHWAAVKAHPWFAGINWDRLYKRQVEAPYRPDFNAAEFMHSIFHSSLPTESEPRTYLSPRLSARQQELFIDFEFNIDPRRPVNLEGPPNLSARELAFMNRKGRQRRGSYSGTVVYSRDTSRVVSVSSTSRAGSPTPSRAASLNGPTSGVGTSSSAAAAGIDRAGSPGAGSGPSMGGGERGSISRKITRHKRSNSTSMSASLANATAAGAAGAAGAGAGVHGGHGAGVGAPIGHVAGLHSGLTSAYEAKERSTSASGKAYGAGVHGGAGGGLDRDDAEGSVSRSSRGPYLPRGGSVSGRATAAGSVGVGAGAGTGGSGMGHPYRGQTSSPPLPGSQAHGHPSSSASSGLTPLKHSSSQSGMGVGVGQQQQPYHHSVLMGVSGSSNSGGGGAHPPSLLRASSQGIHSAAGSVSQQAYTGGAYHQQYPQMQQQAQQQGSQQPSQQMVYQQQQQQSSSQLHSSAHPSSPSNYHGNDIELGPDNEPRLPHSRLSFVPQSKVDKRGSLSLKR